MLSSQRMLMAHVDEVVGLVRVDEPAVVLLSPEACRPEPEASSGGGNLLFHVVHG